ncbi:MAG: S-methyl-5'-thioadenosine phosphorylase [Firmicutes bacterium]|nr:S-methyl-5'-thioadenosine phosphorylase [Bacillota bacterium]
MDDQNGAPVKDSPGEHSPDGHSRGGRPAQEVTVKEGGPARLAIIGGTGVYDPGFLEGAETRIVPTPYGEVEILFGRRGPREVCFLARHGRGHTVPPHRINYRGNIWALRKAGVRWIIASSAVGSLNPQMKPGELVLVDQFLDFTKSRDATFHDGAGGVVHVDFTEPYCPALREHLGAAAASLDLTAHPAGTYVCTEGPRFETPAEIAFFRGAGGDLVGMTGVPEVVLAREAELCYASVALVTNFAAGISPTILTHREVVEVMQANLEQIRALIGRAVDTLPPAGNCRCGSAAGEKGIFNASLGVDGGSGQDH